MQIQKREELGLLFNKLNLTGHGVEVGVQTGAFSAIVRSSWTGERLHLVDRWRHEENYRDVANIAEEAQRKLYLSVVERFASDRSVVIHKMDSLEAAQQFPDNFFDWIYLDADHSYTGCAADLEAWFPKLKVGGVFAGHDFLDGVVEAGDFGVKSAVERFAQRRQLEIFLTQEPEWKSWYCIKSEQQTSALVTLAVGEFFEKSFDRNFRRSLEEYADRIGVPLFVFNKPWDTSEAARRRSIAWQKMLLFEQPELSTFERLCWIDSDVLATNSFESVFDFVPTDCWGAVSERTNFTPEEEINKVYASRGLTPNSQMVNTGVLVLNRVHHADLLKEVYRTDVQGRSLPEQNDGGWFEQPFLSHELFANKKGILLPVRFNRLVLRHMNHLPKTEQVYSMLSASSVFLHWPGKPTEKFGETDLATITSIVRNTPVERIIAPEDNTVQKRATFAVSVKSETKSRNRPQPGVHPQINFAILTHNALEYTIKCLDSIQRHTPFAHNIFIVDNASTDTTPEWLAQHTAKNLHYVLSSKNLGVPGGRNRLICEVLPHLDDNGFVIFLDNDMELFEGWHQPFMDLFSKHSRAGIAGAVGHTIIIHNERRELLPSPTETAVVDVASGGFCCWISASALRSVGFFDENLGNFWHEDDDYCVRAIGCGFEVFAVPHAAVVHHGHKSGVAEPGISVGGSPQNQRYLVEKWRRLGLVSENGRIVRKTLPRDPATLQTREIVVGVDARTFYYTDSVTRGIGHYSLNHLLHAAQLRPDWKFVLYGESSEVPKALDRLMALPNVTLKPTEEYSRNDVDVLHICDPMNFLGGFDSPYRIFRAEHSTVTFYDLIPMRLYFPTLHESFRTSYHQRLKQLNLSNAVALAISGYTKQDLIGSAVLPQERIEVIMAGLNQSATKAPITAERIAEVKARLGINKPFFLHVGALDPHKNFKTTLNAFLACSKSSRCQLVVVGQMEHYIKAYADHVKEHRIKNVVFTGFIAREDLEALYADAIALMFMSMYEGFGFPVLEAMAHGCPVITTNVTSIPEVAGDAALLFHPEDVDGVSKGMMSLMSDEAKRAELREKGWSRARHFTWQVTAQKTIDVWEKMLGLKPLASHTESAIEAPNATTGPVATSALQVLYHSGIFDPSGYADEGRNFILHLDRQGTDVVPIPIGRRSDQFRKELDESTRDNLDRLIAKQASVGCVNIIHFPGYGFQRVEGAAYNIGRTMFETDGLPSDWVAKCNMMDEVWVPSDFNMQTFQKAGVTAKLFKVPSGIDPEIYKPGVEPLQIPKAHGMVFLSIFEWSHRKGWDVLLRAWAKAFTPKDDVTLVLRTYPVNATESTNSRQEIERRIDSFLKTELQCSRKDLARIVILGQQVPEQDLPRLFAAANVYVAPSRGEGWGRPQMAAMASGLPVIATRWSGNLEFMNDENSLLIDVEKLSVIDEKAEVQFYRGQQWAEPSVEHCAKLMRSVFNNTQLAKGIGARARQDIEKKWSWSSVAEIARLRLEKIHGVLAGKQKSQPSQRKLSIVWEGPQFANHSLAVVNREMASCFIKTEHAVSLKPHGTEKNFSNKTDQLAELQRHVNKPLQNVDIHIRHHWPPNLNPPDAGRWVVIQPWEFGSLPVAWVKTFSSQVDEIWAYTNYVKRVYVESGVPADRVHVVPLGIDPKKFHPDVKPTRLKTKKKFRFLFVGGTIYRKGIDLLLEAYTKTFTRSDDVCLVIKDMGGDSFYKGQTFKTTIEGIQKNSAAPEIEYIDGILPESELIGLYAACDVLVHPYRGEGFGLPVLESMACGTPTIVTKGGACLDFCNDANSLLVNAEAKRFGEKSVGDFETVDYPWLFEVDTEELKRIMRFAFNNPEILQALGEKATVDVRTHWTWEKSFAAAEKRCAHLQSQQIRRTTDDAVLEVVSQTLMEAGKLFAEGKFIETLEHTSHAKSLLERQFRLEDISAIVSNIETFKGDCYLRLNSLDEAKLCYEEALRANPASSPACVGVAEVLLLAGFLPQAKTMFEWGVKNDPSNVHAVQGLAKVNQELGLTLEHNALLDSASPKSDSFDELLAEGLKKYQNKDFTIALSTAIEIETAIDRNPQRYGNPEFRAAALNLQGICHIATNNLESARAAFEKSLQAHPESSEACAGLAEVFFLAGHDKEAKTMFEWAMKNDPDNAIARAGLGKVNAELGLDESDNSLLDALSRHTQSMEVQ